MAFLLSEAELSTLKLSDYKKQLKADVKKIKKAKGGIIFIDKQMFADKKKGMAAVMYLKETEAKTAFKSLLKSVGTAKLGYGTCKVSAQGDAQISIIKGGLSVEKIATQGKDIIKTLGEKTSIQQGGASKDTNQSNSNDKGESTNVTYPTHLEKLYQLIVVGGDKGIIQYAKLADFAKKSARHRKDLQDYIATHIDEPSAIKYIQKARTTLNALNKAIAKRQSIVRNVNNYMQILQDWNNSTVFDNYATADDFIAALEAAFRNRNIDMEEVKIMKSVDEHLQKLKEKVIQYKGSVVLDGRVSIQVQYNQTNALFNNSSFRISTKDLNPPVRTYLQGKELIHSKLNVPIRMVVNIDEGGRLLVYKRANSNQWEVKKVIGIAAPIYLLDPHRPKSDDALDAKFYNALNNKGVIFIPFP